MIAGHGTKPRAQAAHKLGAVPQIRLDLGAVDRDVAGVDDEIGALLGDPAGERRPIVGEMRLAGAQMRVRDLYYPHCASWRKAARSGIRAKTCEHPAAIR